MILFKQPKTFVIALKDHPVSEKQLQDCLASAMKYQWDVEVFWGVYGNTLTDDSWSTIGVKPNMKKVGEKGCWFSHYYLWAKCLELNEPIVVLEHDAIIQTNWRPLEINNALIKLHSHYRKDPNSIKWKHPITGQWSPSTHAYCLTPNHAEILINAAKSLGAYSADVHMGSNIIPVHMAGEPEIVSRQNSYSTTCNITT